MRREQQMISEPVVQRTFLRTLEGIVPRFPRVEPFEPHNLLINHASLRAPVIAYDYGPGCRIGVALRDVTRHASGHESHAKLYKFKIDTRVFSFNEYIKIWTLPAYLSYRSTSCRISSYSIIINADRYTKDNTDICIHESRAYYCLRNIWITIHRPRLLVTARTFPPPFFLKTF